MTTRRYSAKKAADLIFIRFGDIKQIRNKKEVDCVQVNVETTPGGYSIIGLNFGPSKAGALDIPGIRYGLGIS